MEDTVTVYVWLGLLILFLVIEIATVGLTTIWMAGGALGALILDLAGLNLWWQIGAFLVVSFTMLVFTRPFVVKYINSHLHELLTVEQIAKAFYLSRSQLNRLFHKRIGSSVYQYIQLKRLIEARLMLKAGRNPGDVARACGYTDYSCFYKAYRKYFGAAPYGDKKAP